MTEIERKTELIRLLNGAIHKLIRRNIDCVYITHRLKVKHARCEQSFVEKHLHGDGGGRKKKEGHWTSREEKRRNINIFFVLGESINHRWAKKQALDWRSRRKQSNDDPIFHRTSQQKELHYSTKAEGE